MQYFNFVNFILLRNSIAHLKKLTKRWQKCFLIESFGKYHGVLYILKILDRKLASNTYYGNHLRIFCL